MYYIGGNLYCKRTFGMPIFYNSKDETSFDFSESELRRKRIVSWISTSVLLFLFFAAIIKLSVVFVDSYQYGTVEFEDIQKTRDVCSQVGKHSMRMHKFCEDQERDATKTPGRTAINHTYDRVYYGLLGTLYIILNSTWTLFCVSVICVITGAYANHTGWLSSLFKKKTPPLDTNEIERLGWMTDTSVVLQYPESSKDK